MQFKEYKKILGLHKEECDGILEGMCYIQEKVDGANASIWLDEDGTVHCGSRTRDLTKAGDGFNGFVEYVKNHEGINKFFLEYPNFRLCGEWLVRHSVGYHEESYKQFYLFDIEDENGDKQDLDEVYRVATDYGIKIVHLFDKVKNPTHEHVKSFAGTSKLGLKGEGVVVKNFNFINKFGDKQWGKYVTQEFKEDNAITFGGNNKHSETYWEMYFVNEFCTLPRLNKILNKFQSMSEERLDMKHIPQIMGMVYHDIITEECWTIAKKVKEPFSFKAFEGLVKRKTRQMFINHLTGDVSVADIPKFKCVDCGTQVEQYISQCDSCRRQI